MGLNVARELASLEKLRVAELKQRYEHIFGETCRSNNRQWLIKRIIWRMQADAEGGLSERARRRAAELANEADLRLKPPQQIPAESKPTVKVSLPAQHDKRLPLPGTILKRAYKGTTLEVLVLPNGFEYQGEIYKSLSAVAKAITGSHTNGYLFFKLNGGRK